MWFVKAAVTQWQYQERRNTTLASSYKPHMLTKGHTEAHQQDGLHGLTSPETIVEVGVEGWRQVDMYQVSMMGDGGVRGMDVQNSLTILYFSCPVSWLYLEKQR